VLLNNSSVLCLYFLALPLVGVCSLSIHQKGWWKCCGARYQSKHSAHNVYTEVVLTETSVTETITQCAARIQYSKFGFYLTERFEESVEQRATGWTARVWFPAGARFQSVHTSSGAHQASYPGLTESLYQGVKLLRHEPGHSPPSSVEVENCGVIHQSSIRLHGELLKWLNTETALHMPFYQWDLWLYLLWDQIVFSWVVVLFCQVGTW
jgi:hypothetical protein